VVCSGGLNLMSKKLKINLEKIDKNLFNSIKNVDEFIKVPENQEEIELLCKPYESLEYPIKMVKTTDSHGTYWITEHPDLPGCITHGNTREEALLNLDDAKKGWIYAAIIEGLPIPKPNTKSEIEDCSGRILLRVPRELHFKLLQKAKEDDTSLNQELVFLISSALGTSGRFPNKNCR
jgi:antitoxin HicB